MKIIILIIVILGIFLTQKSNNKEHDFDKFFLKHSAYPYITKAIAITESNLNSKAIGDNGQSFGLMQLQLPTAKGYGYYGSSFGLLNPETNIYFGNKFLMDMISKYGKNKGIMTYNLGETKVKKGITNQDYLDKVLKISNSVTFGS